MTTKRDYYEILGIQKTASDDEIKKVYRNLALKYHPDRVSQENKKEAEERFKEISEAYAVLSDAQKRAQYDKFGHAGIDSRYSSEDIFRGADFSSIFEDLGFGGESVFGDMFENIFGSGYSSGRRPGGHKRGRDLEYEITVSFEEAALGAKKTIEVPLYEKCDVCKGEGAKPGTKKSQCSTCNGRGQILQSTGFFSIRQTCPHCRGEGEVIKNPCVKCNGSGRVRDNKKLELSIPAGVDTGSRLRLAGEGETGVRGGSKGDLYIYINVREHSIFERHGYDVICEVPLSFTTAALGGEIEIPTLTGNVMMKIPEGTQSGKIFRLTGKGIKRLKGNGFGDELVRAMVETPTHLNAEQKRLLKEFEKSCNDSVNPLYKSFMEKVRKIFRK